MSTDTAAITKNSRWRDSDPQPQLYESCALPLSYIGVWSAIIPIIGRFVKELYPFDELFLGRVFSRPRSVPARAPKAARTWPRSRRGNPMWLPCSLTGDSFILQNICIRAATWGRPYATFQDFPRPFANWQDYSRYTGENDSIPSRF